MLRIAWLLPVICGVALYISTPSSSQTLPEQARSDIIQYCSGYTTILKNKIVCQCVAESVDIQKFPELPDHVSQTLDGVYALTSKEEMLLSSLKQKCAKDSDVLNTTKKEQKEINRSAVLKSCGVLKSQGKIADCDCFLSYLQDDIDDVLVRALESGNYSFASRWQIQSLEQGLRECK